MTTELVVFLCFFLPGLIIVSANFLLFFFVSSEIHGTLSKAPQTEDKSAGSKELRVLISIFVTVGLTWFFGFLAALTNNIGTLVIYDIFKALLVTVVQVNGICPSMKITKIYKLILK